MVFSNSMAKNKSKYFTLMIIPSKSGSSKAIKIPKLLIPFFIAVFLFLVIMVNGIILRYNNLRESQSKSLDAINFLKSKVNSQQQQIDNYKKIETEMKTTLEELKGLENQLKTKYDIKVPSTNTSQSNTKQISLQPLNINEIRNSMTSIYSVMNSIKKKVSTQNAYPSLLPYDGKISSYYGTRRNPLSRGRYEFHKGLDICGPYGSKVRAAAAGVVTQAGWLTGYGKAIIIYHGNGYTTLYGHNSKLLVKKGQRVSKGQIISLIGSTGRSTGPHVHFEVRYYGKTVNPLRIVKGGKQ